MGGNRKQFVGLCFSHENVQENIIDENIFQELWKFNVHVVIFQLWN